MCINIFSFAVVIIVIFVAHGILDQWKSCLNGDFDGKKKRMKSRKASRLIMFVLLKSSLNVKYYNHKCLTVITVEIRIFR